MLFPYRNIIADCSEIHTKPQSTQQANLVVRKETTRLQRIIKNKSEQQAYKYKNKFS